MTSNLVSNLSIYAQNDYRRYFSAHLQYLNGLCTLCMKSVNDSIQQFLSSLFITGQLLPEIDFNERVNASIEQSKSDAPTIITALLFLTRNIHHGNSIISTYGTNFKYSAPWYELVSSYLPSQAIIYDNECSCGLYPDCTTQANFIRTNSSETIPIKGLKIGCTPSESFLSSTLECFYDISCLNLIQEYMNYTDSSIFLLTKTNQSKINITIGDLINNLFITQWLTTKNYSSYYEQCAPSLCSYTYMQQSNALYILTLLLGLNGGLTIVLKWICPKIVRVIVAVYRYRKKRSNTVQPVEIVNNNIRNITTIEVKSTPAETRYMFFSISI